MNERVMLFFMFSKLADIINLMTKQSKLKRGPPPDGGGDGGGGKKARGEGGGVVMSRQVPS